ncbi:NLR family CARD domain-containing protein 3-like [Notolabrus celidotus]|uniref:NLR family CARD domain-containing protein 3-like n=1 Tax=Notolabrus celidotus TaxID=1203425 RepID=UPI0014904274|nr:NLR family CARD domain-containing protein 3-like [Notolabrus celidotus]
MSERRKKRKLSTSSPVVPEQPISTKRAKENSDDESTAPSIDHAKSSASMFQPIEFGPESKLRDTESAAPRADSLKSSMYMFEPIHFGHESKKRPLTGESTAPRAESWKSDASMFQPIEFGSKKTQSCSVCTEVLRDPVQYMCGHWSCKQCVGTDLDQHDSPEDHPCKRCGKKPKYQSKPQRDTETFNVARPSRKTKTFKERMRLKFTSVSEGNGDSKRAFNSIYTELLITNKESEGLHEEHVFRHIKQKSLPGSPKSKVDLSDIFKPLSGQKEPIRTILTKGVAGIGKSYSVQKFLLDWAEGKENQDIHLVFCISFRELNLIKGDKSLLELLTEFHPALKELKDSVDLMKARTIVVLDGLDESRFKLDFKDKPVTSVTEGTSVANLLANLIKGSLLPDAKLWITTRPAAADQIPAEFVDMVTEIRGFSDPQKEEYLRRRCSDDPGLADRIISHIHSSQSLDIMCQIPIFCWISAVLFEEIFREDEEAEPPQTLTEMMAHYLFAQTTRRSRKYDKNTEEQEQLLKNHKEFLLKLGKLAFIQLQNNNIIFYREDLEQCDIDVKEATIFSGFCSEVLRNEPVFSEKIFFFVHLTMQEFFAALFVYDCFTNQKTEELSEFLDLKDEEHSLLDLLKITVEKVLEKENGHLDFLMRFLLGLMVEPNRRLLQGLLTSPGPDEDKKILNHLKAIQCKTLPPDSSIILFQAMVEMRDHKVKDEIQEFLRSPERSKTELTPLHCSALAYMLQVSKDDLEVLDLKSFNTTDEGRRRLIPAVRISRKAILADCKVTEDWVEHLAFGLKFPYVPLRDLDLSNNDLKDSGVSLLCGGLSNKFCKLKILRLSGCLVTEDGCSYLASALQSNPSHLFELDLSYNNVGVSGERMLTELKEDQQYKLSELRVDHGGIQRMTPGFKKYSCELTFDPKTTLKNLTFSEGNRKVAWEEEEQQFPSAAEGRSGQRRQVLCQQGLNERHYFEVEFEMLKTFTVGLTYKTIDEKGDVDDCKLGQDVRSWSLTCSSDGCFVLHGDETISVAPCRSRVAVYLDWPAGTLSFYRVSSDSRTRLHTFKTKFSEPLYPAVELHSGCSASLSL